MSVRKHARTLVVIGEAYHAYVRLAETPNTPPELVNGKSSGLVLWVTTNYQWSGNGFESINSTLGTGFN